MTQSSSTQPYTHSLHDALPIFRGIRHPPRCGAQHQRPEHRLGHVAVIPITGTSGPEETHIPLTADAGLTKYDQPYARSEEHTSELQSPVHLVCRLLLEKKNTKK